MYPITNAVKALFDAEQKQVLRITGTDKNNVSISITDENVLENGFSIDRYSCNGEKLEVGTAIAAQMTLKLNNADGTFDSIVFEGTELKAEVGIADWSQTTPSVTYIPCGYFTPDEQPRRLNQISLTCLDRMTKFDVVVNAAALTLPATVANLVGQVCTLCGVTLAQSISSLTNASVSVAALPSVQGDMTYRNIIQWCAGIMATNAWMDWDGLLRFSWYDNSTSYAMTTANRFSSDLYEDDLTVTGAVYTNASGTEVVSGTDDYAIDLTGNALAGPLVATVLPAINTALNGFAYRPFTASVINAPYLWPMDEVVFTDKDGNDHDSVLTNVAFGINGMTALESKGMTYAMNARKQPRGVTKEQAQIISEAMEAVETNIDESLTQQDIFNRLTDNGAAQGMVLVNGQLYINATYIHGGTLVLGGLNNQNGTMQVLDANGNVVGTVTKDGIYIGDSNSSAVLNSGILKFLQGNVEVGRLWPGVIGNDGFLFIDGPESSGVQNRSSINFFGNGRVRLAAGDEVSIIDLASNGNVSVTSTGTASFKSGGDASLYLTDTGHVEIRSDGGAAYLQLKADGTIYVNNAANWRSALAITPANIGAVATSAIIDIPHGGTGQSTQDGMRNAVFYNTSSTGISSYPTTAGVWRVTGTLPAGMPSGANAYGVLTIVGAGTYYTHRYVDAVHNVYYAYSSAAGAPTTWRKLTSTTVSPVT